MENWMNNPQLKNMDPKKLKLLSSLAEEGSKKGKNDMLPFLMSAMNMTQQKDMNFNDAERSLLLEVLMQNLPPEDKKKAETIIQMTSAFRK